MISGGGFLIKAGKYLRKYAGYLLNPWVLGLAVVLALAVGIWFVAPMIPLGDGHPLTGVWTRVFIILGWLALAGIGFLLVYLLTRRGGDDADSGPSPAEQALDAIVARFERQMGVLREHLPGKRSGRYAYHLPWYLVVGMEGAGKTTLLVNAAQDYPLSHLMETDPLAPVAPTKDVRCWVTNEAVYIDTPGAMFGSDEAGGYSDMLLGTVVRLLNRFRGRRPINGVVLVLSLEDLISKSDHERAVDTTTIRHKLLELIDRLGTRFPIYVVFSKADMLAGFVEFFDDLTRDDCEQIWGITFPLANTRRGAANREAWREVFQREFGRLTQRLNTRLLRRLHQERDPSRRALIYGFPQRFGGLEPILESTLSQIFGVDRYTAPPLLRGIYLTSGDQAGVPHDPLMGVVATSFDVERPPLPALRAGAAYFTQRLFPQVILPEAGLASDNRRVERRKMLINGVVYACCAAITTGLGWSWWNDYRSSIGTLTEVENKIAKYEEIVRNDDASMPLLAVGLGKLRSVRDHFAGSETWLSSHVSLASTGNLIETSKSAYRAALARQLPPRLKNRLEVNLRETLGRGELENLQRMLRVYLMLGRPDRLEPDVVRETIMRLWREDFEQFPNLRPLLKTFLDDWMDNGTDAVKLDKRLVARVREALSETPRSKRVYADLKSQGMATLVGGVEISRNLGPYFNKVFKLPEREVGSTTGRSARPGFVPRLFTDQGWRQYFYPRAASRSRASLADSWVMGDFGEGELTERQVREFQRAIGEHYVRDYIDYWRTVLNDLRIVKFRNLDHAADVLEILSGPGSPLLSLVRLVDTHTSLKGPRETANGGAKTANGESGKTNDGRKDGQQSGSSESAKNGNGEITAASLSNGAANGGKTQPPPGHLDALPTLASFFAPINGLTRSSGDSPSYMDSVSATMADSYAFANRILEAPDPGAKAFEVVEKRATRVTDNPISELRALAEDAPEPLQGWMHTIADRTWSDIVDLAGQHLAKQWKNKVYQPWQARLAGRYPLDVDAKRDASMAALAEFLGPDGQLRTFYNSKLKPFVNLETGKIAQIGGETIPIGQETLRQIRRARKLRRTLFSPDDSKPNLTFTLRPVRLDPSVAQIVLEVGSQELEYRHGPSVPVTIRWPDPKERAHAELRFREVGRYGRILRESASGPWAWFRLLQDASFDDTGGTRRVTFTVSGRSTTFEIWPEREMAPLTLSQLPNVRFDPEI